mmetsp:Transcript_110447/g.235954  ORF Transcript_110447/g.235954 Transcript_110447/m.235954 type:complete len:549 (-) Transcript_110447:63-1709(-)
MPPKLRRASEEEIQRRWAGLRAERRKALLIFDDPVLVERIKAALQRLFEQQLWSHNSLGIKMTMSADPFASSALFSSAFEFTWQMGGRNARPPGVVSVDPLRVPVMTMKPRILEGTSLFQEMRDVVPDFLSEHSGRVPLQRWRWKELWATAPSSISAMEQQLAKLVEQALWMIGSDPTCELPDKAEEQSKASLEVAFEPWMASDSAEKSQATGGKAKRKKRKQKLRSGVAEAKADTAEPEPCSISEKADADTEEEEAPAMVLTAPDDEGEWQYQRSAVRRGRDQAPDRTGARRLGTEEATSRLRSPPEPSPEPLSPEQLPDAALVEVLSPVRAERAAPSDDEESVGMGTFHLPASAAGSACPTAASTPATADSARVRAGSGSKGRWKPAGVLGRPPGTPPSSPRLCHSALPSAQLVCYIWNQASKLHADSSSESHYRDSPLEGGIDLPRNLTPASQCSTATSGAVASTPFARGRWSVAGPSLSSSPSPLLGSGSPSVVSAVVRNTFVDIEDPNEVPSTPSPRKSRSLSPSYFAGFHDAMQVPLKQWRL